jgi:signal transduction histidine kinase
MALPPQLRRFLPLLLVFSSGTILCAFAFIGARRMEEKSIRAEFILGSENRVSALKREIDTNLAALAALRAFAEVFPQQTRNDFEHFAARTVAVYPGIRALEWSPRVPDSERKAFEEQMRRDGEIRPEITEGNPLKTPVRAGKRSEYYPVKYIYPPNSSTQNAHGFDLGKGVTLAAAMKRARETGQPSAAERTRIMERTADGYGIPVLLPVFRPRSKIAANEDPELAGYVMGIFQVSDILERALRYVDARDINIDMFDATARPGRRSLFFYQSRLAHSAQSPLSEAESESPKSLYYSSPLEVAGRHWRIVCTPTQEYLDAATSWKAWVVLAICILTMLSVAVYFTLNMVHTSRNELLVQELSRANVKLNREIGERTRAEEHLAIARDDALEASRLKSQFLANMSHEIRTPMNGIIGMTELLMMTPLSSEQRDYAVMVQHSGEALLTIINDILDFSKIEAGKLQFEDIGFNVTEVVRHIQALLSEQAAVKHLIFTSSIAPNVPASVRGDPTRLGQVLTNLLGNAIKFTESGKVSLSVAALEQTSVDVKLRFEVHDTGIGISPDACQVIFESFAQADGSMTRKYGGTGLGLAISKQIVEYMQGAIGVDSEPGAGSLFWFTVRLGIGAETPANTESAKATQA